MSHKHTTRRNPRKADLLKALKDFTRSVRNAGGIEVIEADMPQTRRVDLVKAYQRACDLIGEAPAPIHESDSDLDAQASFLLQRHDRLIELARKRGYSERAVAGLVMSAYVAEEIKAY